MSSLPAALKNGVMIPGKDGFIFYDPMNFQAGFAADLPKKESDFMASSQVPITAVSFGVTVTNISWKLKPSFAVLATQDKSLLPDI